MKILWIEDKPREAGYEQELFYKSGLVTEKDLCIPKTFREAEERIDEAVADYDLVVFDINLEDFPDIDKHVQDLSVKFNIAVGDFMKVAGFYLYQKLVHQGFPEHRIVFLTANTSGSNLFQQTINKLKSETDPDRFQESLDSLNGMISEGERQTVGKAVNEFQESGNLEKWFASLDDIAGKFLKTCSGSESYDRFEKLFQTALLPLAQSIHKGQATSFHRWLREKTTKENPDFPYMILRRGIIEGCRELKKRLVEATNLDQFILFNKTVKYETLSREYIADYLTRLETFLPLNPPTEQDLRANLYLQFVKELSTEWEMSEGYFRDKEEDRFRQFCHQEMKLLRNWTAHGQIIKVVEKQAAFFFMIAMRAWFDLEPIIVMDYEQELSVVFHQFDFFTDEVKTKLSRSYMDLYKTCKKEHIFCNGIFFSDLFRQLGLSADKVVCEKQSERLFYLNFWHALNPAYINSITPEQSSVVNIQVGFNDDYRGIETKGHIANFLARLIWKESFT